jgi:Dyp-type peroxidase family
MSGSYRREWRGLDLADIQGNIVRAYGRFGFPVARHFFFHIARPAAGRVFVEAVRHSITTAEQWADVDDNPLPNAPPRPLVAINIGFSYQGMCALDLPTRTLSNMPEEFIDGMAKRWSILGDVGPSAPDKWDQIWCNARTDQDKRIHVWVSLNAQIGPDGAPLPELVQKTDWLRETARMADGVTLLSGHRGAAADYQESAALMTTLPEGRVVPTATVFFGFTDGIADPVFQGQFGSADNSQEAVGSGKLLEDNAGWAPLAAGEFIIGHANEAQELPPTAPPWSLTRNGTFMVYRKMHQNIARFETYIDAQAALLMKMTPYASAEAAKKTIKAKMVGRWWNGIPLIVVPSYEKAVELAAQWSDIPVIQLKKSKERSKEEVKRLADYNRLLTDFRYRGDAEGKVCPASAHIRRANPRDALDPYFANPKENPGSALTNRRRILRRGLPYGSASPADDISEHGVIFMAQCASLFRQFEFIQQQWVNYGSSFGVGNDADPIVGRHRKDAKFVIPGDATKGAAPFICANMPQFVETRGGEYFFIPSLTALREIAEGSVDPT